LVFSRTSLIRKPIANYWISISLILYWKRLKTVSDFRRRIPVNETSSFLLLSCSSFREFLPKYRVIYFCPKLQEFLRCLLNRNFGRDFVSFLWNPKFRSIKITREIPARSFGCWFQIESLKNLILIYDRLVDFCFLGLRT
jgi:hypothetical protein